MLTDSTSALWWSACVTCALWGLLVGIVGTSLVALVGRAWRHERRTDRDPGRL